MSFQLPSDVLERAESDLTAGQHQTNHQWGFIDVDKQVFVPVVTPNAEGQLVDMYVEIPHYYRGEPSSSRYVVPVVVIDRRGGSDEFPNEFIADENGVATILPVILSKSAFNSLYKYAKSEDAGGYPIIDAKGRLILPESGGEPNTAFIMTLAKGEKSYSVQPAYAKPKQLSEAVAFVQGLKVNPLRTRDGSPTTLGAIGEDAAAWELAAAERWIKKNRNTPSW